MHAPAASHGLKLTATLALLLCGSACGGSSSTQSTAPTSVDRCSVSLASSAPQVAAEGGTGTLNVTINRECGWNARAGAEWIAFTSPTSGQGNATLAFTVAPNPRGDAAAGGADRQRRARRRAAGCSGMPVHARQRRQRLPCCGWNGTRQREHAGRLRVDRAEQRAVAASRECRGAAWDLPPSPSASRPTTGRRAAASSPSAARSGRRPRRQPVRSPSRNRRSPARHPPRRRHHSPRPRPHLRRRRRRRRSCRHRRPDRRRLQRLRHLLGSRHLPHRLPHRRRRHHRRHPAPAPTPTPTNPAPPPTPTPPRPRRLHRAATDATRAADTPPPTEPPPACTYQVTPPAITAAAEGVSEPIAVDASRGNCAWTAQSGASWLCCRTAAASATAGSLARGGEHGQHATHRNGDRRHTGGLGEPGRRTGRRRRGGSARGARIPGVRHVPDDYVPCGGSAHSHQRRDKFRGKPMRARGRRSDRGRAWNAAARRIALGHPCAGERRRTTRRGRY